MYSISKHLLNNIRSSSFQSRFCSHFRAACLKAYGNPLEIDKFKRDSLKSNEVRVRVNFCSLNFNDVKYLEKSDEDKSLPYIPGYELSGEVLEVGDKCKCAKGDRIVGLIQKGSGGLSEEAILTDSDIWQIHREIPYHHAASLVCAHTTALIAFTHYFPLNENSRVLAITGPGGYGLAAVDVASSIFRAKVIAISDASSKANLLRDRGAFSTFHYNPEKNYKEIMKATDNKGVDVIYDAVGGEILGSVVKCLNDPEDGLVMGTYRTRPNLKLEKTMGSNVSKDKKDPKNGDKHVKATEEIDVNFKTVNIFNYREKHYEEYCTLVQQILEYYEEQILTVHISKTFPMKDVNQAIDYIKSKACTGKVLIQIKTD